MSAAASTRHRPPALLRRLVADERGVQIIEFAMTLPFVFAAFGYAIEDFNLALTNLRISQFALNLADNASRVGNDAGKGVTDLSEAAVNDVLQGTRMEGDTLGLTEHGRVTLSSLENVKQSYDKNYVQRIHWQRCIGKAMGKNYDSTYGTTLPTDGTTDKQANAGTTAASGMGDAGKQVKAPKDTGVMFVEINYDYQPLFGTIFFQGITRIHYSASFMVRDNRDYSQLFNPDPKPALSTCDLHNA